MNITDRTSLSEYEDRTFMILDTACMRAVDGSVHRRKRDMNLAKFNLTILGRPEKNFSASEFQEPTA